MLANIPNKKIDPKLGLRWWTNPNHKTGHNCCPCWLL